jgi:hypothetical protein
MRFSLVTIGALLLVAPAAWSQTTPAASVIGSWVGESKCTALDSPCRDEHVVYRITADKKNPAQLSIDADKIVEGTPQFMGTIVCQHHADQATLSCTGNTPKQDDWEFHISGDTMTGTLAIGPERQVYRRITVRKTNPKAN